MSRSTYLYEWSRLKELSKRICCYLVCLGRFFSLQSLRVDSVAQCFFLSHAFEFWKQLRSYFCCFQGPLIGYFLRNTAAVNQSVPGHHKRWLFAVDFRQFRLTEKQSSRWNQWGIQWYLEDSPSALTQTEQKQSSTRHKIEKNRIIHRPRSYHNTERWCSCQNDFIFARQVISADWPMRLNQEHPGQLTSSEYIHRMHNQQTLSDLNKFSFIPFKENNNISTRLSGTVNI